MRLLFTMDLKDYPKDGISFQRDSARCICIQRNKIAMIHSLKYDYYKFPGGGIEKGETNIEALLRETQEEAGLLIQKESIQEYGYVHRVQKSDYKEADYFIQENYYYICQVLSQITLQHLDSYEKEEQFTLEFVDPQKAIQINRYQNHGSKDQVMIEREARVLEQLIKERFFIFN